MVVTKGISFTCGQSGVSLKVTRIAFFMIEHVFLLLLVSEITGNRSLCTGSLGGLNSLHTCVIEDNNYCNLCCGSLCDVNCFRSCNLFSFKILSLCNFSF